MAAALSRFGKTGRGKNLAGELIHRAHIHQLQAATLTYRSEDLLFVCANRLIRTTCMVRDRRNLGHVGCERPLFRNPFFTTSIDKSNVVVAVIFQLPEGVGGEPIVIVSVKQNCGVIPYS